MKVALRGDKLLKFFKKMQRLITETGVLPVLILVAGIACVVALLFALFGLVDSKAIIAFLGVIVGSALTSLTSLLSAKENRKLQLTTASLDKRLQAHQAAYALWYEMVRVIHHQENLWEIIMKADEFWANNCLYLDPISRKAFRDSTLFAWSHKELLQGPRDEEVTKAIKESWEIIMKPGRTLAEGVSLPSLGSDEYPQEIQNA